MASLSSLEYSSKDSRESIISTTNDDEHSGSKILQVNALETWQDSRSKTWQGDDVEKWHVVQDELEFQATFWQIQPRFGTIESMSQINVVVNMFKYV